ncbi:MAG: hypothetical protein A2934_00120 [Candidatus Sungbacteria bacterium RIFCSPLOWO2_01_FULL_47_10]|uniref:histidine kinase n=1 Tax=Candidatus Sungbacteria bacterium RIFCSPLOWO2_01_FULL_47_10 TaxID=1802276 RepID=A0A1G2L6T3_9BACT|nr:MAG: hypothetical protein A2934_00120 [Candidatus Sungbacteria bacterium RIFCSPLOWO2_01_FULL_47_10]
MSLASKLSKKDPALLLRTISKLSRSINLTSRDITAVMEPLLKELIGKAGVHAISIWTVDKDTKFMKITASAGLKKGYVRYFNKTDRLHLGKGLVGRVMKEKKTLYTTTIENENRIEIDRWRRILLEEGFKSLLVTPMFIGNKIIGACTIYYTRPIESFTKEEISFFEIIANYLAITIENIQNYATIEKGAAKLAEEVKTLLSIQQLISYFNLSFYQSVAESLDIFTSYVSQHFGVDGVCVYEYRAQTGKLHLAQSFGMSESFSGHLAHHPFMPDEHNLEGYAFTKKTSVMSTKVFTDERIGKDWKILLSIEDKIALAALPLIAGEEPIGSIAVYYNDLHEFSEEEIGTLQILSSYIAVSLFNLRIFGDLTAEKNKTLSMVDSLYDGIVVLDSNDFIISVNPRASELLWVNRADIIGKKIAELDEEGGELIKNVKNIITLPLMDRESGELILSEPKRLYLRITSVPLRDHNNVKIGSMRILHDITDEKETEAMKLGFIAVSAHQMRQPLTEAKLAFRIVADQDAGPILKKQKEILEHGYRSVEFLISIIANLLDVSKMEEGRFSYNFIKSDLIKTVQEIILHQENEQSSQHIRITFVKPGDEIPQAYIDAEKMKIALKNILDNAVGYSRPESIVTVKIFPMVVSIVIEISDTGIGIPKEDQKFLFTKFFRAKNAIKFKTEGTGLGLWIANEIIRAHGGRIWIESNENKGTTVSIQLPKKSPRNI